MINSDTVILSALTHLVYSNTKQYNPPYIILFYSDNHTEK